jgi:uncharacterized protein YfdQ (DUF2303 family)
MDDTAIKAIGATAIDADHNRLPAWLQEKAAALPSDYNLISLEKYAPFRDRLRGRFDTSAITDFATYVNARPGVADVFVADTARNATAFFNIGTAADPGHADDVAVLALPNTAAFDAMLAADKTRFGQRDLIDWLEDWNPNAIALDGAGGTIAMTAAIAAIRGVTIAAKQERTSTVGDFATRRTAMDDVEARGALALPAGFRFRCAPSLGLPERDFHLRLAVLTGSADKEPTLTLRIQQREAHNEGIAVDFKTVLKTALGDTAKLLVGSYKA